ncbi:ATP-binding protein [Halospina sp. K52047b]|uniref:AAA family ATPase n=1 Tax=Halospina sp. K52047b TaxID=2614160 RepID=UPI001249FF48|nr:ATP-binding protein [Halospina sp. K52047b]KAA8976919.1 AAA family ATPase [Halospina sp. K52047b]
MNFDDLLVQLIQDGLKADERAFEMRARRIIEQVKSDKPELAKALEKVITTTPIRRASNNSPSINAPVDGDTNSSLIKEETLVDIPRPAWASDINSQINDFILEQDKKEILAEHGLFPSRSILMEGPPGIGKTLTAKWLASRLGLPLITLDLTTVMNSLLGKTGANLKSVFEYAKSKNSVLFLDEFDSIAKQRSDGSDVGELKRLVTSLLQTIDDWPESSVLVAATNHGDLLDPAVWRRFDVTLRFSYPTFKQRQEFIEDKGIPKNLVSEVALATEGLSYSEIEKKISYAYKKALILKGNFGSFLKDVFGLKSEITSKVTKDVRDSQIIKLYKENRSKSEIAKIVGTSRPTVRRVLTRELEGERDG